MRICHLITRLIRGGADENTLLSCNHQARRGHQVHLIYGAEYSNEMVNRIDPNIVQHTLPTLVRKPAPMQDLRAVYQLTQLFRRVKPAIVHTHTSKAGIVGRIAARRALIPGIVHGVHTLPFTHGQWWERFLYTRFERYVASWTSVFVDVGEDIRDQCLAAGIGHHNNHFIVRSGMDIDRFCRTATRPDWRVVLAGHTVVPKNPRFLVLVSRLDDVKRPHAFLPIFAALSQRVPDAVLLLVGEGPRKDDINTQIDALRLHGRVVMTGFREDLERLLAISSLGLLVSLREGLPRALVQYTIAGLPSVATHTPGAQEAVQHGTTGYLVPIDDLWAMMEPLTALLTNETQRQAMATTCRNQDFTPWGIDCMIEQLEALYRRVCD